MLCRVFATVCTALACLGSLASPIRAQSPQLNFQVFTNPHPLLSPGTIGFAYAGNKFVGTVQADGQGAMYSTDLNGANVQIFAPQVSLPASTASSEHFVASSLGLGGFPSRDLYVAGANNIIHITNDGTASNVFVDNLAGQVRGIIFDSVGTYGHDMIVTTAEGSVYRVNSAGVASLLASVGEDTEGADIVPTNAGFGPFDGQLIVDSEGSGLLRAITTAGQVTVVNPNNPIPSAEEMSFVPQNLGSSGNPVEGFYGADYTPDVVKVDAAQFQSMRGDLIVTGETTHQVSRMHFNSATQQFEITNVGTFPNQPEDGLFVTAAVITGGGGPPPVSVTIPSGLQFFSSPIDFPGVPLAQALGYADPIMAYWQADLMTYAITPAPPANEIRLGKGYWARFPQSVTLTGTSVAPTTSNFRITAVPYWNSIGDPFPTNVPLSGLSFDAAGQTFTFAQAVAAHVIEPQVFRYDNTINDGAGGYVQLQSTDSLQPGKGYWIRVNLNTTIVVPHP